jgi:hypothetical protein
VNSQVERRWVETNGVWHLFKINAQDPRFADSEPYDPEQANNGQPTKSLAELRDERDGSTEQTGEVKTAARQPAAKKTTPAAKKTAAAKKATGSAAGDGTAENDPAAGDGSSGDDTNTEQ